MTAVTTTLAPTVTCPPWCVSHTATAAGEVGHFGDDGPNIDGLTVALFRGDLPGQPGVTKVVLFGGVTNIELTVADARRLQARIGSQAGIAGREDELAALAALAASLKVTA